MRALGFAGPRSGSISLVLSLLLTACGEPISDAGPASTPLIISTDNAAGISSADNPVGAPFDDFLVVQQAQNEPGFEVVLVAATFTNYLTDATYFVSRYQVERHGLTSGESPSADDLLRAQDLVRKGAAGPIREMYGASAESNPMPTKGVEFLAATTSADWDFEPLPADVCSNDAVEAMARRLNALVPPRRAIVVAIGALTDVACLIEAHPNVLDRVAEVVYLGGRWAGWHDGPTFEAAVRHLKDGESDPNIVNYLIQMLSNGDKSHLQQLPDANTNADFPGAYRVLSSGVSFTAVVGPLAQQVKVDYSKIGATRNPPTLLTEFLQAGAEKRDQQRDVVAWDPTAFNYLLLGEDYKCETGNWRFMPCGGLPGPTSGIANDVCLTHREPDPGGWLGSEYYQLWIGDLGEIDAGPVVLDVPAAQAIAEDPAIGGVTRPSANTVRVCYDFTSADGPAAVAKRIQDMVY